MAKQMAPALALFEEAGTPPSQGAKSCKAAAPVLNIGDNLRTLDLSAVHRHEDAPRDDAPWDDAPWAAEASPAVDKGRASRRRLSLPNTMAVAAAVLVGLFLGAALFDAAENSSTGLPPSAGGSSAAAIESLGLVSACTPHVSQSPTEVSQLLCCTGCHAAGETAIPAARPIQLIASCRLCHGQ